LPVQLRFSSSLAIWHISQKKGLRSTHQALVADALRASRRQCSFAIIALARPKAGLVDMTGKTAPE
jgi:hypothetical protein